MPMPAWGAAKESDAIGQEIDRALRHGAALSQKNTRYALYTAGFYTTIQDFVAALKLLKPDFAALPGASAGAGLAFESQHH